jgi:hypothetical protein
VRDEIFGGVKFEGAAAQGKDFGIGHGCGCVCCGGELKLGRWCRKSWYYLLVLNA